MLHYTPLQERGHSDSPYSIRDQLKYDEAMFQNNTRKPDGGKAQVEQILKVAKEEYGLLSLIDIVLNHTADDSPWLVEHPESGLCLCIHRLSILTKFRAIQVSAPQTLLTLPRH